MTLQLLQQLVTRQAELRPEQIAVCLQEQALTYRELEEESNRLARLLQDAGCQKGDRIGFLIPKTPAAVVCILGILKADCIYVPLDTSSPAPRLAKIVAACQPRFILAGGPVTPLLNQLLSDFADQDAISIGWMEQSLPETHNFTIRFSATDLSAYASGSLDYLNTSGDAAHILFTSGSTGTPKGVVITHDNVLNFIAWAVKYFGTRPSDRISSHPPLHFDLSTFDLFGTLSSGAQLHLVSPALNLVPGKLADFIRTAELTQWFSVPSVLNFMAKADVVAENDFPTLERLLWCGEAIQTPTLIHWMQRLPQVRFTNLYGPTEATIASSYYTVPHCPTDEREQIPIGIPCDGEGLLVLDDELNQVSPGEIGNLYISGVGLSPGYWQDQEKTDSVFIQRPGTDGTSERIYRTGDLARVSEDGLFWFLGRADTQIKSRGYRIELGEIETALHALQLTEECAVVAINTSNFEGVTICCAFVPPAQEEITPARLRTELSRVLPAYMLPTRWQQYSRLPQNANGKIDRKVLKESFQAEAA